MNGQLIRKAYRQAGLKVSVNQTDECLEVKLISGSLDDFIAVGRERLQLEITGETVRIDYTLAAVSRAVRQHVVSGWVNPFATRNIVWKCVNEYDFRYFKRIKILLARYNYEFIRDDMEVNLELDGDSMSRQVNKDAFQSFRRILLLSGPAEVVEHELIEYPHLGVIVRDRE